jgi:hypothetical protein
MSSRVFALTKKGGLLVLAINLLAPIGTIAQARDPYFQPGFTTVPPEPPQQGGRYCVDYNVVNRTRYQASIFFQHSQQTLSLAPGEGKTYRNSTNCYEPPLVSWGYTGPRGTKETTNYPLGENQRNSPPAPDWEFVEDSCRVYLKPVGADWAHRFLQPC